MTEIWIRHETRSTERRTPVVPSDAATLVEAGATVTVERSPQRAFLIEDYQAQIDEPDLDIDEDTVLIVRNAGPKGFPGMPEIGNVPLPRKLLERGITDIVRISDARMSGTGYGTVVLHVAPEAAVGGPLAMVETGDWIALDVAGRRLTLEVSDEELEERRARWTPPALGVTRGYQRLYVTHVLQANQGADFDFLVGGSGSHVSRDNH